MSINYLKIGKANELSGGNRKFYRAIEILPGFLSWATFLILLIMSFFQPVWVAYFLIAFDVYWLLLVIFLAIHLLASYRKLQKNLKINWKDKCCQLASDDIKPKEIQSWLEIIHLIILPVYNEGLDIISQSFQALIDCGYPADKMIVVLAVEERGGADALKRAKIIEREFGFKFRNFLITIHPDNIAGELKGKGANQTWAGKIVKKEIIDP